MLEPVPRGVLSGQPLHQRVTSAMQAKMPDRVRLVAMDGAESDPQRRRRFLMGQVLATAPQDVEHPRAQAVSRRQPSEEGGRRIDRKNRGC